jgi:uncharacterized protein YbaP (TraB family)
VILCLVVGGPACAPAVQVIGVIGAVPSTAAERGTALPLWELTHEGRTLYLLGSVHLLRQEIYPLDGAIYAAFDEAEVVAFELDFDEMMASAPMMMQRGMYSDGRTLRDVLPGDLHAEMAARAEQYGLPPAMVDGMKPWMAAMTLSSLVLQQGGFEASAGLDLHLHERAKEREMEIVGLETMEEQIDVFEGLDEQAQIAFLRSTLEQLDETVSQMDIATDLWRRGDTAGLGEMFIGQMGDQPQAMERLLYERNRNWIPGIELLLAGERTAIVVVGVGHLAGEGSVIDLLRQRGYTVTQLHALPVRAGSR